MPDPVPDPAADRLAILAELEPKFAAFSPRQVVAYPSIDRAQCDLLRELVQGAKDAASWADSERVAEIRLALAETPFDLRDPADVAIAELLHIVDVLRASCAGLAARAKKAEAAHG